MNIDRVPMIAGNWKMNLKLDEAVALARGVAQGVRDLKGVEVLLAPPFTALSAVREAIDGARIFSGQGGH